MRLADLNTPYTRILVYDRFVLNKKLIFCIFRYFEKSLAAHTKIIVYMCCCFFHVNMFDQTLNSLISQFSNDNFPKLVSTSGFNLKL